MRRALQRHEEADHRGTPGTDQPAPAAWKQGTGRRRGRALVLALSSGSVAVLLAAAGCGVPRASASGSIPVRGGTATYALNPATVPNYIFPLQSTKYFSVVNTDNLQYLMYRPLYWFGVNGTPAVNPALSLAYPPTFQGRTVTIRLKHYIWSDGEQVSAADVVFWMHMEEKEKLNWGGYVPGYFPDNVQSVRAVNPTEVQIVMNGTFSHLWLYYNELSQITPMPLRWDVTKNGKGDCETSVDGCAAVYNYLNSIAQTPATWPHSPLWSIVDGPWQLTSYSSQGVLTFRLNQKYSGPLPKDHISVFQEYPFTSEEAEFNVLQAGGRNALDVGYLPTVDASVPAPGQSVGQSVPGYQLQALYPWSLSYFPYNFSSYDPQAAVIHQLYFRMAFQLLMNQEAIIQGPLHGYGKLTTGVVGDVPRTGYLSARAKQGDPYPFSPVQARNLLFQHGWDVRPGGLSTCARPGLGPTDCGRGVRGGQKLNFTIDYATGIAWLEAEVLQLKANALNLGIQITLKGRSFNDTVGRAAGDCGAQHVSPCPWEMADWGLGWSYAPDYLPTGEELFKSGAGGNLGHYGNSADDAKIAATLRSSNLRLMWQWEDFLTPKLPVVLQPEAPYQLVENINNLKIGVQDPTVAITPEDWYFVR